MNKLHDLPNDWQHDTMERALRNVSKFDLAIDCGAHRGIVTNYLKTRFTHVVSIEPSELADKISGDNVTVVKKALGDKFTRVGMEHGKHNTGQRHVVLGSQYEMITLDSLELVPDFIKIDVEGFEFFLLNGAEKTIRTHKPIIIFEENGLNRRYGIDDKTCGTLVKAWGMRLLDSYKSFRGERDMEYVFGW